MAGNTFILKVLTPAGLAIEEEVSEVYLPSSRGEIGVLPQHAKYTGLLGTGKLSYVRAGSSMTTKIVISEGFASFTHNTLSILSDSVDIPEQIDRQLLAQRKAEALKDFEQVDPVDPRWQASRVRLARYEAVEELLSH